MDKEHEQRLIKYNKMLEKHIFKCSAAPEDREYKFETTTQFYFISFTLAKLVTLLDADNAVGPQESFYGTGKSL